MAAFNWNEYPLDKAVRDFLLVSGASKDIVDIYSGSEFTAPHNFIAPNYSESKQMAVAMLLTQMLKTAKGTNPSDQGVAVTPWGLSKPECNFMRHYVTEVLGMPETIFFETALGYMARNYPEERQKSDQLGKWHSAYRHFLKSVEDSKETADIIKFHILRKAIRKGMTKERDTEFHGKMKEYFSKNREQHWDLTKALGPYFFMTSEEQFAEAMQQPIASLESKLKIAHPTDLENRVVDYTLHAHVLDDGVIDDVEKIVILKMVRALFNWVGDYKEECADDRAERMLDEDVLSFMALEGYLGDRHIKIPNTSLDEVADVRDKTDGCRNILKYVPHPVDDETIDMLGIAFAAAGIRGAQNMALLLESKGVSKERLMARGIYDVPGMISNSDDPIEYFQNCALPIVRSIIDINPDKFRNNNVEGLGDIVF